MFNINQGSIQVNSNVGSGISGTGAISGAKHLTMEEIEAEMMGKLNLNNTGAQGQVQGQGQVQSGMMGYPPHAQQQQGMQPQQQQPQQYQQQQPQFSQQQQQQQQYQYNQAQQHQQQYYPSPIPTAANPVAPGIPISNITSSILGRPDLNGVQTMGMGMGSPVIGHAHAQRVDPGQPGAVASDAANYTTSFPMLGSTGIVSGTPAPANAPANANGNEPTAVVDEGLLNEELERKIQETERAEFKRRRKGMKIASMARYNDLMTGGESSLLEERKLSYLIVRGSLR